MSSSNNTNPAVEQLNTDSSTATFVSALIFNAVVGVGFYTAFSIVRTWNKTVYEGRTYLVEESKRSPPLKRGFWGWQRELLMTPDSAIIKRVGLDAYMFLKFMRFCALLFTIFTVLGLPILMPVNSVGQLGLSGINVYTMGNVSDPNRFWAHLLLSALFAITVVYLTWKEMTNYIDLRQKYLVSESHSRSPTATTILVTEIPPEYNSVEALRDVFEKFPGGVDTVYINSDVKKLLDKVKERQTLVEKLEGAETAYIKSCVTYLQGGKSAVTGTDDSEKAAFPEKIRPKHRTGFMGLYGKKVDSIDRYREEIVELNKEIAAVQSDLSQLPAISSAFIRFRTQIAAHMSAQSVIHSTPLKMTPRFVEIAPQDIVWDNLNMTNVERLVRMGISYAIVAAIALLWAIPTAFVASIASIEALAKIIPFLKVLTKLPPSILGIIQGILPPVFLSVLTALVPIIFSILSKLEGIPTNSGITLSLFDKFYFFLMVNVLFVTTLANGIFATLPALLRDPTSSISLLATNVPKASTFFITYVLLSGLNGSGLTMLQLGPLVVTYIFNKFFTKTPRAYYNLWSSLGIPDLGQIFPQQTLVFAIGLVYSVIAPVILPFVAIYYYLYYFVYMYQFLYSFNTPVETGGLAFPKAIRHVYVALFIFELLMIGILLGKGAIPQAIIMIIIVGITAFVLFLIDYSFTQLLTFVPVTLADSKISEEALYKELEEKKRFGLIGTGADLVSGIVSKTTETVGTGVGFVGNGIKKIASPVESSIGKLADALSFGHKDQTYSDEGAILPIVSEQENHALAYLHPSITSRQPTIWIPRDEYGVAAGLVKDLDADNLANSTIGATIVEIKKGSKTTKAKVSVAKEVFEAASGVPGGMRAPIDGGSNNAQDALNRGIYADNAVGNVLGNIGRMG